MIYNMSRCEKKIFFCLLCLLSMAIVTVWGKSLLNTLLPRWWPKSEVAIKSLLFQRSFFGFPLQVWWQASQWNNHLFWWWFSLLQVFSLLKWQLVTSFYSCWPSFLSSNTLWTWNKETPWKCGLSIWLHFTFCYISHSKMILEIKFRSV